MSYVEDDVASELLLEILGAVAAVSRLTSLYSVLRCGGNRFEKMKQK